MNAGSTLITAEGVSFAAGSHQILDDVGLELGAGEILTLIGPNGSGKTVLVRILLGLLEPDTGEIRIPDNITIGYVPQRVHIDRILPLRVARFVSLAGKVSGSRVAEVLAETGADHLAGQPVHSLSGGEFQRVLLARALVRKPDLLVLDEPVQGVDIAGQDEVYRLIEGLRDRYGAGVLMVSHDLHVVMAASDRVICLNGHICCSGKPEAVSRDPAYMELFGEAATALALYSHDHDHHHHEDGTVHTGVSHAEESTASD